MEISTVKDTCPRASAAEHPLLLPHQLAALRAILDVERNCDCLPLDRDGESVSTRHGIFGDKPGSGKSYVISELLLKCGTDHIPRVDSVRRTLTSHMTATVRGDAHDRLIPISILVVPHNLVTQWSNILAAFSQGYDVAARLSDLPRVYGILSEDAPAVKVVVLSVSLCGSVLQMLRANSIGVARIVFDEADSLRFSCPSQPSVARFYWFVTASVQNLFSGMDGCMTVHHSDGPVSTRISNRLPLSKSVYIRNFFSCVFGSWARFAARTVVVTDNAFVDSSFSLLEPASYTVSCAAPLHSRVLLGLASEDVMRRLDAGDLDTALLYMQPDRTDSETNIIAAALSHFDVELRNSRAELEFVERRQYTNPGYADMARERLRNRIAVQEDRIRNVKDRIQGTKDCLICYDEIRNKTVVPCCNNSYCLACITKWVTTHSPRCPMCKSALRTTDFMVCTDHAYRPVSASYEVGGLLMDRNKPKDANLAVLLSAIAADPADRKILLFCDNEYAIDHHGKRAMDTAGIKCAPLKGNSAMVNKRVKDFNEGSGARALLVNCSHYGCGQDLSKATDVIIYHAVDTRMDAQIIGRAQRPPRTSRLNVWRFVSSV